MAIGDAAAAAGLPVIAGTRDKRLGYSDINAAMDEVANEKTARTSADSALSSGKLDASKVIISDSTPSNIAGSGYSGRFWIKRV